MESEWSDGNESCDIWRKSLVGREETEVTTAIVLIAIHNTASSAQ